MSQRLYLPAGTTTALTPAFSSAWEVTAQAVRRACSTTKQNTTIVAGSAVSETLAANPTDALDRQYVSSNTIPSARTIAGTMSAVIRCSESVVAADGFLQLVVRVFSSDGLTERGVLYAGATQTAVVTTAGAQNQEMTASTADTRIWDAIALSPVAAQAGDIIVIEIGWRATNTSTTSYTTARRWGDPTATADHALTAAVATELCPWVEFSDNPFLPQVVASRATTWTAAAAVVSSRATTWQAGAAVAASRATTWGTLAPVVGSRGTTWNVAGGLTAVVSSRATTWNVAGQVAASRLTTWTVLTPTVGSRATTWQASGGVAASRGSTWNVAAPITGSRATTWHVRVAAVSSRATTWHTLAQVGRSKNLFSPATSTSFEDGGTAGWSNKANATLSSVVGHAEHGARSMRVVASAAGTTSVITGQQSADPTGAVSFSFWADSAYAIQTFVDWYDANGGYLSTSGVGLGTPSAGGQRLSWFNVSPPAAARQFRFYVEGVSLPAGGEYFLDAVQYEVGTAATSYVSNLPADASRATTWNVRAESTASRVTTWRVSTPVTSSRATSWVVRAAVVGSRATSWAVAAQVAASRSSTWNVRASVVGSRAASWAVLAAVSVQRSTTWNVAGALTTVVTSRVTTWHVFAAVAASRSTSWAVRASVAASRQSTWSVAAILQVSRATTWHIAALVSASRASTWDTLAAATGARSTSWSVQGRVVVSRPTSWSVQEQVSTARDTSWAVLTAVAAVARSTSWDVLRSVLSSRSTSWAVERDPVTHPVQEGDTTYVPGTRTYPVDEGVTTYAG